MKPTKKPKIRRKWQEEEKERIEGLGDLDLLEEVVEQACDSFDSLGGRSHWIYDFALAELQERLGQYRLSKFMIKRLYETGSRVCIEYAEGAVGNEAFSELFQALLDVRLSANKVIGLRPLGEEIENAKVKP